MNYLFGKYIGEIWETRQNTKASKRQTFALWLNVIFNLSLLIYFKYSDFLIENFNFILTQFNLEPIPFLYNVLPLGISFYTFQAMSYTIDVYRRDTVYTKSYMDFTTYLVFFPQLVAGPIVRYVDVANELKDRLPKIEDINWGIKRFIRGLSKKVLIANLSGEIVDQILLKGSGYTFDQSLVMMISYTFQIYFDFSGYSDMAIGIGRMLGFKFHENFNFPYSATSIQDFWRRWHISLSTWFKDYLYIPLGGNRSGKWHALKNSFIVFILCGFWHGASYNFVFWGFYHGCFLALEKFVDVNKLLKISFLKSFYVMSVVGIGWIFFRLETFPRALDLLSGLVSMENSSNNLLMNPSFLISLVLGYLGSSEKIGKLIIGYLSKKPGLEDSLHLALLVFVITVLIGQSFNPFIYFRF